jgi:2-polyprenyl-6-methoxyphenol hydroxylase-like FAD-dependent oxidoreductase
VRVAIVGLGPAGCVLALLLTHDGHEVTILEQAQNPGAAGAGIWLQPLGQHVLDELGLLASLRAVSRPVSRLRVETVRGREVASLGYSALPGTDPAMGVHRGALFDILHDAIRTAGVLVRPGVRATGVRTDGSAVMVDTNEGVHGPYHLVVGADGARSAVRSSMGVTRRDHSYGYGALWAVVDDPDGLTSDELYQCLSGTRRYFGVLPTGAAQASLFWSIPTRGVDHKTPVDLRAWRREALPFAREHAPLVNRVTQLLTATYRDVVVATPYRSTGSSAAVLVGDAAHASSPQLGTGTSLALADAWSLAHSFRRHADLDRALSAYAADRAAHWRWYRWWTRLLVPVFQSRLDALAIPRDLLGAPVSRLPGMEVALMRTLLGDRVSLGRSWSLR